MIEIEPKGTKPPIPLPPIPKKLNMIMF